MLSQCGSDLHAHTSAVHSFLARFSNVWKHEVFTTPSLLFPERWSQLSQKKTNHQIISNSNGKVMNIHCPSHGVLFGFLGKGSRIHFLGGGNSNIFWNFHPENWGFMIQFD